MDTWIGRQLGPYELQTKLGAGGMGVVYRAVHQRLGQARAIKVLPAMLAHDETFLQRFEREARLASELRHPNIVMIYDIAEEGGLNYIVMELLDGRSLHEVIRQDGPLPLDRGVRLLRQLAEALDFAHQRGVVHRDIKPGNALVSEGDHLTLVDFGIARAAEGTRLTEANSRIGTAEYMAPESITEGDSGAGTDLYALGVIAYEMLTGRVPFTGLNSQTIMYAQIHTPPPSPRSLRTDLSPAVERVVLRQLDKDPTRRYPTATAFVDALEGARTGVVPPDVTVGYPAAPAPTAQLDERIASGALNAAAPPAPDPGATRPLPGYADGQVSGRVSGPRSGPRSAPLTSGRVPVPSPPTPPGGVAEAPPPSGLQRVLEESKIGNSTIYKLSVGGIILFLLLMTFLPTPQDPRASASARLAFPFVAGHMLGTDRDGLDELSLMMVGGRFLFFRLLIVGLLLTGLGLLVRKRLRKRTGRAWPSIPALVLVVSLGVAASVVSELVFGIVGSSRSSPFLGPIGWLFLGMPAPGWYVSWGMMLVNGREVSAQAPWLPTFPAIGLILVATALVLLGSGIADVLRQRARRP